MAPPLLAQRLGPTFWLPDTMSRAPYPTLVARNPADGLVYVFPDGSGPADDPCIIAVDPYSNAAVARISFLDMATGVCFDSAHNRMFCGLSDNSGLLVVDLDRKCAVETLSTDYWPLAPCYYAPADRAYFASYDLDMLLGVDCATGAEVLQVPIGSAPFANAVCTATGRLFSVSDQSVVVVDCATDSVIARIDDGTLCFCACLSVDEARCRVYVPYYGEPSGVLVLDAATGAVLDTILLTYDEPMAICYNPVVDRIYVAGIDYGLCVIDAATNSYIGGIPTGGMDCEDGQGALCLSPSSNRLYYFNYDDVLSIVDCSNDCIVAQHNVPVDPTSACWDPGTNRIYCAVSDCNALVVVDCATDSMLDPILTAYSPNSVALSPQNGKLYVSSADSWLAMIVDPATGRLLDTFPLNDQFDPATGPILVDSAAGRGYVQTGSRRIAVLDLTGDSTVATIYLPEHHIGCFSLAPGRNRIYARVERDTVLGIDTRTLQVVSSVPIGRGLNAAPMAYDPGTGRLFCPVRDHNITAIDVSADTVVGRVPIADFRGLAMDTVHARVLISHTGYRGDSLTVLDAATLSVVNRYDYQGNYIAAVCSDPAAGRFYYARHGMVFVLDAQTGQKIDSAAVPASDVSEFFVNHAQNEVWCMSAVGDVVIALDAQTLQVKCSIDVSDARFDRACATPDGSIIYFPTYYGGIATIVNHAPVEAAGITLPPSHTSVELVTQSNRQCLLIDACGRVVRTLAPRISNVADVPSGVYFIVDPVTGATRRTTIVH